MEYLGETLPVDMIADSLPDIEIREGMQQAFQDIVFFVDGPNYLKPLAHSFAEWKHAEAARSSTFTPQDLAGNEEMTLQALTDIHWIIYVGDGSALEQFRAQHEYSGHFERLYAAFAPKIKQKLDREIPGWSNREKLLFFRRAKAVISELPEDQREYIYKQLGYSDEERKAIVKNIAKSAAVTLPGAIAYESLSAAAAIAAYQFLESADDNKKLLIVRGLQLAHLGIVAANGFLNVGWLRNEKIGWCPNGAATGVYYLVKGFVPHDEKLVNFATILASAGFDLLKTLGWVTVGALNTNALAGGSIAGIAFNATQAAAMVHFGRQPEKIESSEKFIADKATTVVHAIRNKVAHVRGT